MSALRQLAVCCIAVTLLPALPPSHAAPAADAVAAESCHAGENVPRTHDDNCALGCETAPGHQSGTGRWGPANARPPEPEGQDAGLVAPQPLAPRRQAGADPGWQVPRAPPLLTAATPVARHDILRD